MKGLMLFLSSIWGGAETDQARCQAEANFMAEHRWFAHCGPTVGKFEGVGWGKCESPVTCEPPPCKGYKLSGDATAVTSDGITVRVRSWR